MSTKILDFNIEIEQENDGRWIAEVPEISGALAYGLTPSEVTKNVQALALRIIADRLENEAIKDESL